jgi:hypothetical protein
MLAARITRLSAERRTSMLRRVALTVLVAIPMAGVAVGTASHEIEQLNDPCATWGLGNSGSGYIHPHDPCSQRSGHSETKAEAYGVLAAVQGIILLAAVLAIWGAAGSRPKAMLLAGVLMVFESVPLVFSLWPLALLTGGGLIYLGISLQKRQNPAA